MGKNRYCDRSRGNLNKEGKERTYGEKRKHARPNPKKGYGRDGGSKIWQSLGISPEQDAINRIDERIALEEKERRESDLRLGQGLNGALDYLGQATKAYIGRKDGVETLFEKAENSYLSAMERLHVIYPNSVPYPDSFLSKAAYLKLVIKKELEYAKRSGELKRDEEIWAEEKLWAAVISADMGDLESAETYYESAIETYRVYGIKPYKNLDGVMARLDLANRRN